MTSSHSQHSPSEPLSIAIVGGGSLGEIVVRACIDSRLSSPECVQVIERKPETATRLSQTYNCSVFATPAPEIAKAHVIVLAVKPQDAEALTKVLSPFVSPKQAVLSLMAGIRTTLLREWLGHASVVRAMPNIPARYGEAVTVVYAPESVSMEARELCQRVLSVLGVVLNVQDEKLLDAATAISGTGPAYFFALIEELENVAREMGFSAEESRLLVKQTAAGAARMMREPGVDPKLLRQSVTSPGGTTAAAFAHLDALGWGEIFKVAVRLALKRAEELGAHSGQLQNSKPQK